MFSFRKLQIVGMMLLSAAAVLIAQTPDRSGARPQEISDADGTPVILKHLPEWERVKERAVFINSDAGLKAALGERAIFDQIDFAAGTEAAFAEYDAGKLLIVEYMTPQLAADADQRFLPAAAAMPQTVYRRVGNYAVFVFDAADGEAAARLIDQVKYEKTVQWLGEDPYLLEKLEKYFVSTTRDVFIATVIWIVGGLGISIFAGLAAGIVFYQFRERERRRWSKFSDAGGLTRLNLDELSE